MAVEWLPVGVGHLGVAHLEQCQGEGLGCYEVRDQLPKIGLTDGTHCLESLDSVPH